MTGGHGVCSLAPHSHSPSVISAVPPIFHHTHFCPFLSCPGCSQAVQLLLLRRSLLPVTTRLLQSLPTSSLFPWRSLILQCFHISSSCTAKSNQENPLIRPCVTWWGTGTMWGSLSLTELGKSEQLLKQLK